MRHLTRISVPACADSSQGLCTTINDDLQARFCFVLAFLTEVFVPLVQPFIDLKAGSSETTSR